MRRLLVDFLAAGTVLWDPYTPHAQGVTETPKDRMNKSNEMYRAAEKTQNIMNERSADSFHSRLQTE